MPFNFTKLSLPGTLLIKDDVFSDERGLFMETYRHSEFAREGITEYFIQDNYSRSKKNVLRGLHYQRKPNAQGKLVYCLTGRIFDVAVDIRKDSPTYARWFGIEMSEENRLALYLPSGFAHGFLVLSDTAEVMYKCTEEYSPGDERGIIWNDSDIKIGWPVEKPILSEKDKRLPALRDADNNFYY